MPVTDLVFFPHGRFLLSASLDRTLRIWDVASGKECHCFEHEADEFCCLAISADGHWAATGSLAGAVRIWRLPEL